MPLAVRFVGELNREAWQHALNTLFSRHEALRSVFVTVGGQPRIRLLPIEIGIPIRWEDLRGRANAETELERLRTQELNTPFDLSQDPLIRALMISVGNNEHFFLLTQHHIVSDGWSMAILHRELSALYSAYCQGEPDPLTPLDIQYPDYAAWQKKWLSGDRLETDSSPRPAQQSYAGEHFPIRLDSQLTRGLKHLSQKQGLTLHMTILAAWSAVLSRLSGQDDIVIGSPTANRNHHQIESLIGFFVNTLALRIDMSGEPTVRQLLERVRRTTLGAQAHQDLPFEQVVDIVQPPRNMSHSPLFQVMFVWQNNEESEWRLPGLETSHQLPGNSSIKFDMELILYESSDEITGVLGYSTALFDRATVERQTGYLNAMLQAMVADECRTIKTVDLIAMAERALLLQTWNTTQQDYPAQLCVHNLFEKQVESSPKATALVFMDQSLTYAELNARANRLAHHLIKLGVKPDMRVAICVERSFAMIIGVLAILKAGGAYVPLDPAYASERLRDILADAEPSIAVVDKSGREAVGEEGLCSMTVVDPNTVLNEGHGPERSLEESGVLIDSSNPQISGLTSRNLAYVIYTSGSTGKPKGVMIEHQGVSNLVTSRPGAYGAEPTGNVVQFPSFGFDSSVVDIFSVLSYGGALHVLPDRVKMDRTLLWEYLEKHSITQALLPPAILQECTDRRPLTTPLTLIVAGEALPVGLIRVLQSLIPNGRIVNDYGPTETTPVPLGAVGELYIGGVGVARGYLNRSELTAKVFLQDPFVDDQYARMYKTGDLARYLPDGNIEFLGRNDHQVKIRGFRIELGEIEARLSDHPLVQNAVVVALGDGNSKRLVAYVIAEPKEHLTLTLRSYLASCLPDYMVPGAFVRLDEFPLSANGKLDRRALPQPDKDSLVHQDYEAPEGHIQHVLSSIWMEILKVDKVGRHDNFFDLGGNSLLAVRLVSQIRTTMGFKIPLSTLFKSPTLAELAQHLLNVGNTQDYTFEVMLPIKPQGSRPPLFCIHPGLGMSWCYIGLAKHLHADQPLYAIQQRGFFDEEGQPASTIEEMVSDYINEIRQIQPHGPYSLLGFSFGGLVAHAMAIQLEQEGERVALLANMDARANMGHLAVSQHIKYQDQLDMMQFFGGNDESDDVPTMARAFWEKGPEVALYNGHLSSYHSLGVYTGDMILFRAMKLQLGLDKPMSGEEWEPYVLGKIETHDIDSTHDGMISEEWLGVIGGILTEKLDEENA
ncbi:hypothetical protein BGZ65_010276 [Modicella reniformis]|uniref:Carrier domain-containing protein n=1 Tax=Modicella reniformis TaxID=1440133 RepID=A0A9P6SUY0_9FUNG|nr:hypothetical protein BGZ65_010276 [Modicella reniformis]